MHVLREVIEVSGTRVKTLLAKPRVLARLATSYAKARVLGRPAIFMADVNVTKKCNFTCDHCFATAFNRKEREPDTATVRKTIRALKDYGVVFFNFQGGEVLMRPDLEEILRACDPRETSVVVTTNGYTLTPELIRKLRDWGVYGVAVSLDSMDAAEHDAMREMPGALERVLRHIDEMQRVGLVPIILTVATRESVHTDGFRGVVEFAAKRKIAVSFLVAQMVGRWAGRYDVLCTPTEIAILDGIHAKYPFMRRDTHNTLSTRGCPAFKYSIYVTPGGEVCPCPFVHVSYGNLHDESLATICERAHREPWWEKFEPKCPAAEDPRFIEAVQSKTFGRADLPIRYDEIDGERKAPSARRRLAQTT